VTRSLGDRHSFSDGLLLDTPEIHELLVETGDVVLAASDGLWDMVKVDDVLKALEIETNDAARHLAQKAQAGWRHTGKYQDDISVVIWRATVGRSFALENLIDLKYQLHESTGEWLSDGNVHDPCKQLKPTTWKQQLVKGIRRVAGYNPAKDSTCGKTWAVYLQPKDNGHGKPDKVWNEVQLSCFLPSADDGAHPSNGSFGVCRLSRGLACGERPSGCRKGARCIEGGLYKESDVVGWDIPDRDDDMLGFTYVCARR
jgi:hypothetical protein